ncbi:acyl-CoA N-acyltransferase [Roridomyces roridus]|uniref:Acyl-CoA N-acyltransferase n=1 Tax=Roridomyces roridus TaxID=1738132 RepID=A0AAD7BCW0_9AGAR|nr:acyl-CoA N-acyltransferase [Roridomyces roridus]
MNIRLAKEHDLLAMQAANLQNLPENYSLRLWIYHIITWPQISFVAEDAKGRIVGYVLAKIADPNEDEGSSAPGDTRVHGHINSISVLRTYRRQGLAKKLMLLSQESMMAVYNASVVSLHVRRSNKAAIALYRDALGFAVHKVEVGYYADKEDALSMQLTLPNARIHAR